MTDRFLEIFSINYDFVAPVISGEKSLFVTLRYPTRELRPGMRVALQSLSPEVVLPRDFKIIDVIGTRVVLSKLHVPGLGDKWTPLSHGGHWGYATRTGTLGVDRSSNYGHGNPIAILLY